MLKQLIHKYKNSKGILNYFFLTYLDKIISFVLPLSVLFIINDKTLYSFVEIAFSYATLAMIVIELGVSNFLFFGYKNATDKDNFLKTSRVNFKFLLCLYGLFALLFVGVISYINKQFVLLAVLVIIRTLFTLFLNFYSNIYRLRDKPSGIYLTSILVNLLSFVLLMIANKYELSYKIFYFFIPALLFLIGLSAKFLFTDFKSFVFNDFKRFIIDSLQFSWPIILNVLAMSFINNYAKIYAYGHLSEIEMVQISYIMRICLIVQLTHSAFASYFSKTLFMDQTNKINLKLLKQYSFVLLFSAIMVVVIMFITNALFDSKIHIPLTVSTILFIVYTILWCYIGYLEIYFGVMNANRKVLYYSIISSIVYILLLKLVPNIGTFELSLFMVASAFFNLVLVIVGLNKLKVLQLNKINV